MSYAIYKTEALILRLVPEGEANFNVVFFTKELGKITVRAQSARVMQSKMRMHLTRYRHVIIDVVRGKNIWRLTGIADSSDNEKYPLRIFPKIVHLVDHLIVGEMAQPEIFNLLVSLLHQEKEGASKEVSEAFELFGVIKLLEQLGYWSDHSLPEIATDEILKYCSDNKKMLVMEINDALSATQIMV